jgi:hypothetical protein
VYLVQNQNKITLLPWDINEETEKQ